jgi:regulator of replication initiation timing
MKEGCMSRERKGTSDRIDAIYDRQGGITGQMKKLVEESAGLGKENEKLPKKMGWW